jgi:ubiquinone/menaquinone biosynthesis C-methylase UbiE
MSQIHSNIDEINALEKIAAEYVKPDPGRMVEKKSLAMITNKVLPWIKGPDVLEMGVGDDEWTSGIIEKTGHTHIVDAAKTLLEIPKKKYGGSVTTYESLFEDFAPDKKFDTIIASFVLEHVEDPILVLKKSLDWLKDSGKLIAIVPHANSLHRRLAVAMGLQQKTSDLGDTDRRMGHRRVYDIASFEHDIKSAGYDIELEKGFIIKLVPQSLMTNFSDELLNGFMALSEQMPIEYASTIAFVCKKKK